MVGTPAREIEGGIMGLEGRRRRVTERREGRTYALTFVNAGAAVME